MECVQFFVESYAQIIGHIAWPLTVLIVLFIFRKPTAEKLRGLKKFSKGQAIAEFMTTELREKISEGCSAIFVTIFILLTYKSLHSYNRLDACRKREKN